MKRRSKTKSGSGETERMAPHCYSRTRADYGEDFDGHVLEQYRLFVDSEERLVARRQGENRFFLSINALIVTVLSVLLRQGISDRQASVGILLLGAAGVALCWAWLQMITSYKDLNTAKFKVIDSFERQLPVRMFGAEWDVATANGYEPFTTIEKRVPYVFGVLHLVGAVVGLLGLCGVLHT